MIYIRCRGIVTGKKNDHSLRLSCKTLAGLRVTLLARLTLRKKRLVVIVEMLFHVRLLCSMRFIFFQTQLKTFLSRLAYEIRNITKTIKLYGLIHRLLLPFLTVNGGWSSWNGWTSCSKSCGSGSQSRSRSCTKPSPKYGGKSCQGIARQSQLCNKKACPGRKLQRSA